jgi:hypothetical protein
MKKFIYITLISFLWACSPEELIKPYPCVDGDCNARFYLDEQVQPNAYQDANDYWHIEFYGPKYFTIRGELDQLVDHYVINDVPLIEVGYDSDYWVAFNNITFTVPTYSFLGWFTGGGFNNPVPIDEYTIGTKHRKARQIKNFKQDMDLNSKMFDVALEYVNA